MAKLMLLGIIFVAVCGTHRVHGQQQYILTGPADTQYIPTYQPAFDPSRPYLHRDLQTSDLPFHLQQTLPQYRTTPAPPYNPYRVPHLNFQTSRPAPFQAPNIIASTHRPNYSHLFAHLHQKNPAQTETFLGEIMLQSPADAAPPHHPHTPPPRPNFLNHRTRIFAPEHDSPSTLVKDYFVNSKGDVYSTTTTSSPPVTKRVGFDLESLLEEPIRNDKNSSKSDDMVEVVQSHENDEESTTQALDYEDDLPLEDEDNNKTEAVPHEEYQDEEEDYSQEESNDIQDHQEEEPQESTTPEPLASQSGINTTTTPLNEEVSTDTWVVVASVQTSRSVSGARYLPSPKIEQDERHKLLNEEPEDETTTEETTTNDDSTTLPPSTTLKQKTSTESLIDKLDRVQSDLSSGLLSGGFHEKNNNIAVITESSTTIVDIGEADTSTSTSTTTTHKTPLVNIRKFSPKARPVRPKKQRSTTPVPERMQGDEPGKSSTNGTVPAIAVGDVNAFLPPGFKLSKAIEEEQSGLVKHIIAKARLAAAKTTEKPVSKPPVIVDEIPQNSTTEENAATSTSTLPPLQLKEVDISAFLPPGYKPPATKETSTVASSTEKVAEVLKTAFKNDISAFLPPGYSKSTTSTTTTRKPTKKKADLLSEARPVDISAFLPPGYKPRAPKTTTAITEKVPTSLLPPGFKFRGASTLETPSTPRSFTTSTTTAKPGGFKVVFPSRAGARKSPNRLTTPRMASEDGGSRVTPLSIQKGWPSRATTEFTGWPTPSTTPISIEKLLEAARAAAASSTEANEAEESSTSSTSTTTARTTTTTMKATTPGLCVGECDLAGTIKLVGGAKWAPELIDRNTKEWQVLANEVQTQLESVYSRSGLLKNWYKKIRIDGFSEGSVLVDYLVELNDLGRRIDTVEIKKLFHESLEDMSANSVSSSYREGKALNESDEKAGRLSLGNFVVDPKFTDFVVLPKQSYPTVGYAEDNVLLPQWAIAVIVIGLASLLFVIIFGVTVLVNRQKNAKKKSPTPLTDDMLNELNKNHMGGIDNYGAEDLYNMEDVWNERAYEQKAPKKRSSGSIHDNSMSNLYDSWRSEWNGYYYNAYYGNNPGSSHSGYAGRRRSDYDTNF